MTCACLLVLLSTWRKINFQTLLISSILVVLLLGIATLTGRRKAIVEVAVFASTYFILWVMFERNLMKVAIPLVLAALLGFGWLAGQLEDDSLNYVNVDPSSYSRYLERAKSAFGDAPVRFVEIGIAPVMWAYDSFGLFGAGLGVGTQGAQHIGGDADTAGAAEGGLGKIVLELGIPGLLLIGWLAISVFKHFWRIMRTSSQISPRIARLSYSLFSFLVANVAAFVVATQAFGDIFILLILSWTLGFLFAIPVLIEREVRARQPKIFEKLSPVFRPKTI
jgi:hypothetical protein